MNTKKLLFVIKLLAAFGILLAVYLLWQQIAPQPQFQVCNISSSVNCDAVISGEVSSVFGVPTPLVGLVGYVVIFFAAMRRNKKLVLGMASFGLLFCMWIAYRELFEIHVICPVCIACQCAMIGIFILGILLQKKKIPEDTSAPRKI